MGKVLDFLRYATFFRPERLDLFILHQAILVSTALYRTSVTSRRSADTSARAEAG